MKKEINKEIIEPIKKNHPVLKKIGILLILLIASIFLYSRYFIHQWINIKEYSIINETLPNHFNGFKITQFSDIHFGRTINESELKNIVEKINLTNPDILIFTGDLLDNAIVLSDSVQDFLIDTLKKTNVRLKKYAILGDSDFLNEEAYKKIMTESGFTILENQNELIFYEGITPIMISGVSSIQKKEVNNETLFHTTENNISYHIVLTHEPLTYQSISMENVDLIFSGHSLGGLIYIPGIGQLLKKEQTADFQKGAYKINHTDLYVSSGLGTEKFNFRFLNNPEINLYRLYNYN